MCELLISDWCCIYVEETVWTSTEFQNKTEKYLKVLASL